jgi:hypothetical protein
MNYFNSIPVFNSEDGELFFNSLSEDIGRPKDMKEIAILSTVKLLVYLPEPICTSIITPMAGLPMLLNHPDSLVKKIVKHRLQSNV